MDGPYARPRSVERGSRVSLPGKRSHRRAALLVALAAAGVLLGACGGASDSEGGGTEAAATTAEAAATTAEAAATTAEAAAGTSAVDDATARIAELEQPISAWPAVEALAEPVDLAGKKIALVPLIDAVPLMHGTAQGFTAALEELGAEVSLCDGAGDPTKVATCLTTAGDQGVDAAVTLFIDYQAIGNAVDALTEKGIPVLIGGQPPAPNRPADELLGYADHSPFTNLGFEALADAALAAGGENASVVAGRLRDSSLTTEFSDTMVNTFKELCPDCPISTFDFTAFTLQDVPSSVSAALAAQPDTNIVVMPDDGFVPPAMQGIQSAGFADKVQIVSYGADPAGLERVKAGQEVTSIGYPVEYEGWRLAHGLMQLLSGEEVTPVTELVTRAFTPNNIGEIDLKPENYFTSVWYGDDSFKEAFLAAWGAR